MKRCTRCGVDKPLEAFRSNGVGPTGPRRRAMCGPCDQARKRERERAKTKPWPEPMDDEDTAPSVDDPRLTERPGKQRPDFKLLHLDIETSPILAWAWGTHDQEISPDQIVRPSSVLCFAAQWHNSSETIYLEARSRPSPEHTWMMQQIHGLLSEADAVCHYNGTKFDLPRLRREFLLLGMRPPPPVTQIDLYSTIRKHSLDSGKLAWVLRYLAIGGKIRNAGWPLWTGCMDGDPQRWSEMATYCRGDIKDLPELYTRLLPWIDGHPNLGLLVTGDEAVCPNCAGRIERSGVHRAATNVYARYQCIDCGRWSRSRTASKTEARALVR